MESLDLTNTWKKKKLATGSLITVQGQKQKALILLHSGLAEVLTYKNDSDGASTETIVKNSNRIGLIRGESVCGILDLRTTGPYEHTIRCISDCIVSSMPMELGELIGFLQKNPKMNLQVLKALIQRIESALYLLQNYRYLWHKLAVIQDSISLACFYPAVKQKPELELPDRYETNLTEYTGQLKYIAENQGHGTPEHWDHNVFLCKIQNELNLYQNNDKVIPEDLIDNQQFLFLKRLLRKQEQTVTDLLKDDEPTSFYIFQFLAKNLEIIGEQNEEIVSQIIGLIQILFGNNGWIVEILEQQNSDDAKTQMFNYYLNLFSSRGVNDIRKLVDIDLEKQFPVYTRLKKMERQEIAITTVKQKSDMQVSGGLQKYNNLLDKILTFAELTDDFNNRLKSNIAKFKNSKKQFEMDSAMNSLKAELNDDFWQLYEHCFLKIIATDMKAFVPGVFLHLGLLDETLVKQEDLQAIDEIYSKSLQIDSPIPVLTLPYFLEKIYNGEVNPSISEMGQSFKEILKRQQKMSKRELEAATLYNDTPEDKVRYEIRTVASDTAKLLFGSKKKAVPFICAGAMQGSPDFLKMDPEKVTEQLEGFRQRDFSLFYRDVVCHHKFGSDIIKKEVMPYFVVFPGAGSRMMMWQELDGPKRDSRGRIFLPLFFNEKQDETLITILAHFRWELQKVIAGAKWMDPVDGALIGVYYDYINFYKKNSSLTAETKEKITELVKKTRSDRDRFAADYMNWILHEYEGRIKLNTATRDIFYRYCPFQKAIREDLAKKPLYSNLDIKYRNRQQKVKIKMETRKKKFEKSSEPLPDDLEKYISFLTM